MTTSPRMDGAGCSCTRLSRWRSMATTITPIGIGGATMTRPCRARRAGWSGRRVLAVWS
jgi:hypothetical protein